LILLGKTDYVHNHKIITGLDPCSGFIELTA